MNRLDEIKQKLFPTVMVPNYEDLPPYPQGESRLLIAKKGLFLESSTAWGRIVTQLWENQRSTLLPYGEVSEFYDDFFDVLDKIAPIILNEIYPLAAAYAEQSREWAGWIVSDGERFSFLPLEFESTASRVNFKCPELHEGQTIVADIHSHGKLPPYFSFVDDGDDRGGVRICICLGYYRVEDGNPCFSHEIRFVIEGFFVNVEYSFANKEQNE